MDIWNVGAWCIMSFLVGGVIFSTGQANDDWKEIVKWKRRYYRLKRKMMDKGKVDINK